MTSPPEYEYTVLLVFPGFGDERDNAETIVEAALEWLNTYKDEPGFRFAPPVGAHLEIVPDIDEARARVEADDSVAMILFHDVDPEERDALVRECEPRFIPACYTIEGPRPAKPHKGPWQVKIRSKPSEEVRAHKIRSSTLTDPVAEDDEDTGARVGELIAVMALGVMEHHFRTHPPRIPQWIDPGTSQNSPPEEGP
jgi:hypothetical protein